MLVSLTKNKQSEVTVRKMAAKFFAPVEMVGYTELTEGYFNVAYEVFLRNGRSVILKVAPAKDVRIMTYEKNIMQSEVSAMCTVEITPIFLHQGSSAMMTPVPSVLLPTFLWKNCLAGA